jgi:hypothetical protein
MVAAPANPSSLFAVLGTAARQRTSRGLATQLIACLTLSAIVITLAPQWWSLAALLGAPSAYAAWGLMVHRLERRPAPVGVLGLFASMVAAAGGMLAVAGVVGLALALFTGHGRSPYDACGTGATTARCRAIENPPPGRSPIP